MPRRDTRSANCHREIAESSVALPKDRMPWAYREMASSHRRRSSTSPSGNRRLRATESETVSVMLIMLIVLLRVYAVVTAFCKTGGRQADVGIPERLQAACIPQGLPLLSTSVSQNLYYCGCVCILGDCKCCLTREVLPIGVGVM
jgi:hypothetical protein